MIRLADNTTQALVRDMWKICFGDSDSYMDIYFREKYQNENTLIYFESDKAVSSLQMLPFLFTFHHAEIPIAYYSGLSTLPEARKKGYMAALIRKSFDELFEKEIPLGVLVPQNEGLFKFYEPFGFSQTFHAGIALPDLQKIVTESGNLEEAYERFDSFFRHRDMCVQKTFTDFSAIEQEAALFHYPKKRSLIGMSRVINAERLLKIFARQYPEKLFSISIQDDFIEENNAVFRIEDGDVERMKEVAPLHFDIDINRLVQLLLGYEIDRHGMSFRAVFPQKEPLIGFMLE